MSPKPLLMRSSKTTTSHGCFQCHPTCPGALDVGMLMGYVYDNNSASYPFNHHAPAELRGVGGDGALAKLESHFLLSL
jgi:hypothetical protein